jgi:hypothetical protein
MYRRRNCQPFNKKFRKSDDGVIKFVAMKKANLKNLVAWSSLAFAIVSAFVIAYVKYKEVFVSGNHAATLVLISLICSLTSLLFGLFSLRTWKGVLGCVIAIVSLYFLFFTRLYWLA